MSHTKVDLKEMSQCLKAWIIAELVPKYRITSKEVKINIEVIVMNVRVVKI